MDATVFKNLFMASANIAAAWRSKLLAHELHTSFVTKRFTGKKSCVKTKHSALKVLLCCDADGARPQFEVAIASSEDQDPNTLYWQPIAQQNEAEAAVRFAHWKKKIDLIVFVKNECGQVAKFWVSCPADNLEYTALEL